MNAEIVDTNYDFKTNLKHLKRRIAETSDIIDSTIKGYSISPILSDDNVDFIDFNNYKIIKSCLKSKNEISWVKFKNYHSISGELNFNSKIKMSVFVGSIIDNISQTKYNMGSSLTINRNKSYNLSIAVNSIILFDIKGTSTELFLS